MPVYNEAATVSVTLDRVLKSPVNLELEVVCVDDGSTDESLRVLCERAADDRRIVVVAHERNRGKGAAIRSAIDHMSGDLAIIQDADLEYDPVEFPGLLAPIIDGRADVVYGSRFAGGPERRVLFFWHDLGNRALTLLCNVLNDVNLTDMETCYKAFRADLLRSLWLSANDFRIEPELTSRVAAANARIYEVPISYHGRTYEEGKKIGWTDGLLAVGALVRYRFLDRRIYRS
jgi:glycosyltransferase involved in cell wall biosynthesis